MLKDFPRRMVNSQPVKLWISGFFSSNLADFNSAASFLGSAPLALSPTHNIEEVHNAERDSALSRLWTVDHTPKHTRPAMTSPFTGSRLREAIDAVSHP